MFEVINVFLVYHAIMGINSKDVPNVGMAGLIESNRTTEVVSIFA